MENDQANMTPQSKWWGEWHEVGNRLSYVGLVDSGEGMHLILDEIRIPPEASKWRKR